MNCFVLMPFASEFDDVYVAIKASFCAAIDSNACRCFRLDETRPAGRITDRLLQELKAASLCVADLTGNNANVMWEVGFAMALGCPTIIVTQSISSLPFDLRDMQSLQYDRDRLNSTLSHPLKGMIIDTFASHKHARPSRENDPGLVGELMTEVASLKSMLAEAVQTWNPSKSTQREAVTNANDLRALEGAWINEESGSHVYARVIGDDLVAPYCWGGNEDLTGVYFDWRKTGDYWFARFRWLDSPVAGFAFLKHESMEYLRGAWWYEWQEPRNPVSPPNSKGVTISWRKSTGSFPDWANKYLKKVAEHGFVRPKIDGAGGPSA